MSGWLSAETPSYIKFILEDLELFSDGRITTHGSKCTHTLEEPGAWWVVDIGGPYNVQNVTITNRAENLGE